MELADAEESIAAAEVEVELVRRAASEALDLLADIARAYRVADKATRRTFNQAFFERISIAGDGEPVEASYAEEVWEHLEVLGKAADREKAGESSGPAFRRSSKEHVLVGAAGFEPATSRV
jgi:hypothetical protein